jgi:hypothetical protein
MDLLSFNKFIEICVFIEKVILAWVRKSVAQRCEIGHLTRKGE